MAEVVSKNFEEWRSHFLVRLIWLITALGTLVFLSSISAILERGLISVLFIDLAGLAILFLASFWSSWSLQVRSILTSLVIYLVGLNLVFNYGFLSAGHFFLFMVPVFATIFFSTRAGFILLGVNAFTWLTIYFVSISGLNLQPELNGLPSKGILTIFINIFGPNLLVILPIGGLLKKLKSSLAETEQVKNELALQNETLQSVNEELDEFLYRSAHDLRSPLTSLLGLINIARHEVTNETLTPHFEMMTDRVDDLDDRLMDILQYSRNLNTEVENTPVQLKEVIDTILLNYQYIKERFIFKVSVQTDTVIYADSRRLCAILENLIGNAVKYLDPEKEPFVKISFEQEGEERKIMIEDNGLGIPEEYRHKIFDRFFRAHESSTGSGLGLYIAQKSAEKINGSIGVDSEEGKWSVFTLILNSNHA